MRWKAKKDGYKRKYAWFPFEFNGEWVWLEWYLSKFMGDCYYVKLARRNRG